MSIETTTDFTSVDSSKDPQFFLRFLDAANTNPSVVASKPIILDGLRLRAGARVLDLGCGLGDDTFHIAERVGATGRVTGVDVSASMIDEAQRRAETRGLRVDFEVGDSQALRFADGTFDGVRAERMLMHVPDADRAIAEMARVLVPGGRISVFDMDWETQVCDSPYKETTRTIALTFCDGMKNGWIGRRMPRLFKSHGIVDVAVETKTVFVTYEFLKLLLGGHVARLHDTGVISREEANQCWSALAAADRDGSFLYGFTAFIVSGTKA
ncbi:MAG TPA: methyltransferase domain-containing protein [Vicinamibacterales bacterium]